MEARAFDSRQPQGFRRMCRDRDADRAGPVWSLHLVHRETGAVMRVNGMPLVIYTRDATEGLASLLEDRDPRLWRAEVSRVPDPRARI
ncbi:hypothetical protein [Rhodobacter sp. CZR27]|uniref:hypothetical protein n=1 Tax=Rhodobacter sp. CZR27 TaxID=2033869 RepID=UPI000BBE11D8|nr:hypothetical protein [Rhodobacter sp. CZR27]